MSGSRTLKLSILADVDNLKKNLDTGSKEVEGFGGKLEKFGKVAAAAFAAAAAAAVVYAGKLAIEGVKAAIEDEAAQLRLANALKNVTGATDEQIASVEKQILKMSLANGIADDQLRPAFQRLATSTGSLTKAQDALELALNISAATGRDVNTVANALGKAYDGNTGALAKLGIGLSTAEIKALGLDGTMKQLESTFKGAAQTQANTIEGQMNRLKTLFDETKESVGAGLLPAIQGFLDYVTGKFIPMIIEARDKALEPIKKAFNDNRFELEALWKFIKNYLVPIFEVTLVQAIKNVGTIIGTITNIIGGVIRGIESLVNKAIETINYLINAWNAIPDWAKPGGDIKPIKPIDWVKNTGAVGNLQMSTGTVLTTPTPTIPVVPTTTTTTTTTPSGSAVKIPTPTLIEQVTAENAFKQIAPGRFDPSAVRRADEQGNINITVNGAIDPASTARQIAEILNNEASASGSFSGLGISRFATRFG